MSFFFFKQKTAYEMRISDWSSDVCSSDLAHESGKGQHREKWPQAQLQAEASAEIAQDTVKITLASEISDASQTAVASALSKTLEDVMKQAKGDRKSVV